MTLVDRVQTPTLLLGGEIDHRVPIAEAEQFYQALKLRGVDTALVRFPGTAHGIQKRPSHQIAQALYIQGWFDRQRERD